MVDILVVEDNEEIGTLLVDFLEAEGYSVSLALDGEAALMFFTENQAKLVLLDIMLPGIDGFTVCQTIRGKYNIPIFIVSAKIEKEDKLNGLILGADDYIEKPYDIDILIAKIAGVFKRRYENDILMEGEIKIEKSSRKVYLAGIEIALAVKEYELLLLLIENKGKVLKKDWIFNRIWGFDSFSEPQTLTVHIKWLRQKIEKDPKDPMHIQTVWGVGYRFQ